MTTFTKNCSQSISQNLNQAQHGLYQLLQQWFRIQNLKIAVENEREQLLELSNASLRDLGITRAQATAEAFRRDLPAGRLNRIKNRQC